MPPIPDLILFLVLAAVSIASALGMIVSKNAVYSALHLILNFAAVSLFYLMLGAPFISMAQITVYAGAIMVLFLFVIMLLGAERNMGDDVLPWQRPMAYMLGAILLFEGAYIVLFRTPAQQAMVQVPDEFGSPQMIGESLFSQFLLPFEVTSILLLVAIVGVIVLNYRRIIDEKRVMEEKRKRRERLVSPSAAETKIAERRASTGQN